MVFAVLVAYRARADIIFGHFAVVSGEMTHLKDKNVALIGSNGYVGSYLRSRWSSSKSLKLFSVDKTSFPVRPDFLGRFQDLPDSLLESFQAVIFFAGSSSVPIATAAPFDAARENCFDLVGLAQRLRPDQLLVYASSGSVYGNGQQSSRMPFSEDSPLPPPQNIYDATKAAADSVIMTLSRKSVGLRMGTVSGWSLSFRKELVFNAMVAAAALEGFVRVSNPDSHRSILFLPHLAKLVENLIERAETPLPKVLNLGSADVTMGALAELVADQFAVPVVLGESHNSYSFRLDSSAAWELASLEPISITEQAVILAQILNSRGNKGRNG